MIGWVLGVGLLLGIMLPALSSHTNCGGNSYALYACKQFITMTQLDTEVGSIDISKLGEDERSEAAKLAKSVWTGHADFLIRTNFATTNTPRLLVIVCERPFNNVPQPTIWNLYRKNPAHAVGYSDGSTALISPAEFEVLNFTGFIHLSSLGTNISAQPTQP